MNNAPTWRGEERLSQVVFRVSPDVSRYVHHPACRRRYPVEAQHSAMENQKYRPP